MSFSKHRDVASLETRGEITQIWRFAEGAGRSSMEERGEKTQLWRFDVRAGRRLSRHRFTCDMYIRAQTCAQIRKCTNSSAATSNSYANVIMVLPANGRRNRDDGVVSAHNHIRPILRKNHYAPHYRYLNKTATSILLIAT